MSPLAGFWLAVVVLAVGCVAARAAWPRLHSVEAQGIVIVLVAALLVGVLSTADRAWPR